MAAQKGKDEEFTGAADGASAPTDEFEYKVQKPADAASDIEAKEAARKARKESSDETLEDDGKNRRKPRK